MKFETQKFEQNLKQTDTKKSFEKPRDEGIEEEPEKGLAKNDQEKDSYSKIDNEAKEFTSKIEMVKKIKEDTKGFNIEDRFEKSSGSGPREDKTKDIKE